MKTGVYNRLRWQIAGERWGQYQTPLLLAFPLPRSLSPLFLPGFSARVRVWVSYFLGCFCTATDIELGVSFWIRCVVEEFSYFQKWVLQGSLSASLSVTAPSARLACLSPTPATLSPRSALFLVFLPFFFFLLFGFRENEVGERGIGLFEC